MKLLYISTARIPSEKANTYQVLQMCDAFVAQGATVTLLYPRRHNLPEMDRIEDINEYYGLRGSFTKTMLPTLDLILASQKLFNIYPRLMKALQNRLHPLLIYTYSRSLISYITQYPAEIYYTRSLVIALNISKHLPKLLPNMYCEIHDLPNDSGSDSRDRVINKHMGGVVTITSQLKQAFVKSGFPQERLLVAPDGVDLSKYEQLSQEEIETKRKSNFPQNKLIVGYVGRLHTLGREKGITHLIDAIALVNEKNPELGVMLCCIGGPDSMARDYKIYGIHQGLGEDRLIFVPQVPPTEIPLFLKTFDICAMPFPWTEHYAYFMSPLKLFEYMAAERPILATALPSTMEILRHKQNGYLVQPDDPESLAEGIRWLAENPSEARKLAKRARKDVEQYTWVKRAEKILDFIGKETG